MIRLTAFVTMLSLVCVAQAPKPAAPPEHFLLAKINSTGSQRYSTADIVAALQLKTGTQVTQKDLQDASQRLGNSGLFQLVRYQFGWQGNGVVATFELTDAPNVVPVAFENFVWFTAEDLNAQIKSKLPLYSGTVPLGGDFRDQVQSVLQEIIAAKNLHGSVTAMPQGPLNGAVSSMLYSVDGHSIKISACEFSGADHADKHLLSDLTLTLQRSGYQKSFVDNSVASRLRDIYDTMGYLAARFESPKLKIVSETPDETSIELAVKVDEGQQYKLAGVQWSGNTLHSADELSKLLKFEAGQPASLPKFRDALIPVRRLYGQAGYVALKWEISPILDQQGTATFKVNLSEGEQYHLRAMQVRGVDPQLLSKMMAEWKIKPGDVYDSTYPETYMQTKFGKFVPMGMRTKWRNREIIHDDTKLVDLLLEISVEPHS